MKFLILITLVVFSMVPNAYACKKMGPFYGDLEIKVVSTDPVKVEAECVPDTALSCPVGYSISGKKVKPIGDLEDERCEITYLCCKDKN